jgi:hypothetical protein
VTPATAATSSSTPQRCSTNGKWAPTSTGPPALGPGRAPVLLAADPALRAILVTALPGRPVHELEVPADTEAEIHRQAGMLLRRLHDALDPPPAHPNTLR